MIIADTGGLLALLDRDDKHHEAVREAYERGGDRWVIPWAVLPEVDYLAGTRLGWKVAKAFAEDVRAGVFNVDASVMKDLPHALKILDRYPKLNLGLVDAVVMAQAERHKARGIVTLDARHFRAVKLAIKPAPRLIPLDA